MKAAKNTQSVGKCESKRESAARMASINGDLVARELRNKVDIDAFRDPIAEQIRIMDEWKQRLRPLGSLHDPVPGQTFEVSGAGFARMDEMARNARRQREATEDAERRTVAALETMLKEAQASKQENEKMLWWARAAGIAGIVAVVLTVLVPVVQTYLPK